MHVSVFSPAGDEIRYVERSRGRGDVYSRQLQDPEECLVFVLQDPRECLVIVLQNPEEYLVIVLQNPQECLVIVLQNPEECLVIVLQNPKECLALVLLTLELIHIWVCPRYPVYRVP